ncbi:hypothetical protein PINS_up009966 [Pythium insidiosum]|nr:hypothetical protein PINS_up009966 [Pythium insidiosum]
MLRSLESSLLATLRTKFFLRGKQGVEALWGAPPSAKDPVNITRDEAFGTPRADIMEFSNDGSKIVLVESQRGFTVHDTET